jgi:hypothetical protein
MGRDEQKESRVMSEWSRREFIVMGGAAALAGADRNHWHQRVRRVGQVNFKGKDVVEADVEAWAKYWAGEWRSA